MMSTTEMQKDKLKLNKNKCHFSCTLVPFFGEKMSKQGMRPDLRKMKVLTDMPPPNSKRNWRYQQRQNVHGMEATSNFSTKQTHS